MDSCSVSEMINQHSYQRIHRWLDCRNVGVKAQPRTCTVPALLEHSEVQT